ncbi:MAG: UDP-N-acetylmuramate dehydrogenase [candidate division FCPU426 bacterium]
MNWQELSGQLSQGLLLDEPMARHTSFKIGGPSEAFARPGSMTELKACLDFAAKESVPVFFLAGGTNLLVRDAGIRGLTLKLEGEFKEIRFEGLQVHVGAGANLALLSQKAAKQGLSGLEFAVGIPGTVGGGLVMNAGAHGSDLSAVTTRISYVENGVVTEIPGSEAGFEYRSSRFKNSPALLLWADMVLKAGDLSEIQKAMDAVTAKRRSTQPQSVPNAGCVFKNPAGESAGRLIEACGLKGASVGGAQISEVHANFVVNTGGAKAADVLALMERARNAVMDKFQIRLQDEVLVVGEA